MPTGCSSISADAHTSWVNAGAEAVRLSSDQKEDAILDTATVGQAVLPVTGEKRDILSLGRVGNVRICTPVRQPQRVSFTVMTPTCLIEFASAGEQDSRQIMFLADQAGRRDAWRFTRAAAGGERARGLRAIRTQWE